MGAVASSARANFGASPVRAGLATSGRFAFLPLRAVEPLGWLREQLQIQASGLIGHLGPNSGWLGGKGESWERGPYYLDGYVPLAYLLDDDAMKKKAQKWIDWTLDDVHANGMIGPASDDGGRGS